MSNSAKKKPKRKKAIVYAKVKCKLILSLKDGASEAKALIESGHLGQDEIFIEKIWGPYFDEKELETNY